MIFVATRAWENSMSHGCRRKTLWCPIHVPGKDACQVEAKTVNVHLPNPVLQAINYETGDYRVATVDRVSASCKVAIEASIMRLKVIKARISKAFEIDGGPFGAPFCGMVEGHVHDDPHSGLVEGLHHIPELPYLVSAVHGLDTVTRMGGKESCGCCIPSSL